MRFFYYEEVSDQRVKNIFLNNLSMWVMVYISSGYTHMVNFLD